MPFLVSRRRANAGSWLIVVVLAMAGLILFVRLTWAGILFSLVLFLAALWQADRILHTVYQLDDDFLCIQHGRYSKTQRIHLTDIVEVTYERRLWGMWTFLLLTLRNGRLVIIQPDYPRTWHYALTSKRVDE